MLNEKFDSIASAVKDRNIQNDHAPNYRGLEFKWAQWTCLRMNYGCKLFAWIIEEIIMNGNYTGKN